jgi:hypothetical protein
MRLTATGPHQAMPRKPQATRPRPDQAMPHKTPGEKAQAAPSGAAQTAGDKAQAAPDDAARPPGPPRSSAGSRRGDQLNSISFSRTATMTASILEWICSFSRMLRT